MSSSRSSNNFKPKYNTYMGGVTGFKPSQFRIINGFSNLFFGWGGEDDILHWRTSQVFKEGYHRLDNDLGRLVLVDN